MIAFAVELGWWAIPAAVVVGTGVYYLHLKYRSPSRGAPGEFVTVDEVREELNSGKRLLIADVRSESAYKASATTAYGAVRMNPAHPLDDARKLGLPAGERIVTFCA